MSVINYSVSEDELLDNLKLDNQDAFTMIYRKYWQSLYNSAYKRLKNREQSQDIVQMVFTSLWDRRKEVNIQNLSAYLHTSIKFQVFKLAVRSPKTSEFLEAFENIIASPVNTDDFLIEREILLLVKAWIDILPEKRRKIFLLYYDEGLSTAQIAEELNISRKTVQNQLNTASVALRVHLAKLLSIIIIASFGAR